MREFPSLNLNNVFPDPVSSLSGCREKNRDFDYLSSIEVLIVDQADVILMQNWDHLLHVFDHTNLQPTSNRGTDILRIRNWALDGL